MRNIKDIKAELSTLRAEYEAKVNILKKEIIAVQKVRGYVPVKYTSEDYYEMGRSSEPTNGWN